MGERDLTSSVRHLGQALANKGFFVGWPLQPLKFTDLPPTVRPVVAEPPAVEESIEECFGDESSDDGDE